MYDIVSIDPGRAHVAWAAWNNASLQGAGVYETPGECDLGAVVSGLLRQVQVRAELVVLEQMAYRPGRSNSQPHDLLDVMAAGSAVAARVSDQIVFVAATVWKGQEPKVVTQSRVDRRLTALEASILQSVLAVVRRSRHHDVYDAVGLGLYRTGRMA